MFVLEEHRSQDLGKWLVETVLSHLELQGLRRGMLATRDAHELYRKYAFTGLDDPEIFMKKNASYGV